MLYIVEYELCALLFLMLVKIQFFRKPRFPSQANRLFGIIMVCACVMVSLDIVSAKTIEASTKVPLWFNQVINLTCYGLQIVFPVLLPLYVLAMIGLLDLKKKKQQLLLAPAFFLLMALLFNPFTGLFFFFDQAQVYHRGPWRIILFIQGFYYFAATLIILQNYRDKIQKRQYKTIWAFVLLISASMLFQALHPRYLITGAAVCLSITMMHFTLQNPGDMLEAMSGVFNYSALLIVLQDLLDKGKKFHLVAVDVEGVKQVNNMFGLLAGNEAIGQIGSFLLAGKKKPFVFRMIGTCFVVISFTESDYQALLSRVESRFQKPWNISGNVLLISAKVRHFSNADFLITPGDVVSLLEIAFYDQPVGDKFSMEIDENLLGSMRRQLAVEAALREALESGEGLRLYFQPIYSLEKKRFTKAEALLRFFHRELGEVSPAEFIPIAEKKGLALKIDEWVVREACWIIQRYGLQTRFDLESIEINLSAAGILHHDLPEKLIEITRNFGIAPSFLSFEVTETAATVTNDVLISCMEQLLQFGFRFVLDDFGSGYANITQVVSLPFYSVKLDRTLLEHTGREQNTAVVFEDTLRMLKHLGMVTVVEGVESGTQLMRVNQLRPDYIQGFYYSRPLPDDRYVSFLSEHWEGGQGPERGPVA